VSLKVAPKTGPLAAKESWKTNADAAVGPFCGLKKSFQRSKQILYNHFFLIFFFHNAAQKSKKNVCVHVQKVLFSLMTFIL
jgi:hypothetical protein